MKMQYLFEMMLDILFPKIKDVQKIEKMDANEIFEKYEKANEVAESWIKPVFFYKNKDIRRLIWEIKYKANKRFLEKMGVILYDLILEEIAERKCFDDFQKVILIPVPASKDRMSKYGFNQCELLAREILKADKTGILENGNGLLEKVKNTEHQVKMRNKRERINNIFGSFSADKGVMGRFVIVVDDVVTTGATMREAKRALETAGAKNVIGFSVAH